MDSGARFKPRLATHNCLSPLIPLKGDVPPYHRRE